MNLPNTLTVVRIILSPVFLLLMLMTFPYHYLAALAVFVAAALTDFFDGRIARSRGLITNFGKFLDPLADKMLTTAAFLAFLVNGHLNVWALMIVLTREFMVTSIRLIAAKDGRVIAANRWGKAKTVMQFVAILFLLTALEFSTWRTGILSGVDLSPSVFNIPLLIGQILVWISVAMTAAAGINYVWLNRDYFTREK